MPVESLHRNLSLVAYPLAHQHILYSLKDYAHVKQERQVVYIPHVEFKSPCMCNGIASVNLRPPCNAWANLMAAHLLRTV